ncbi:MAG: hypothetical protein NTV08_07430 [Verrucomicrobia bacterium]|nr:hypothetical protein [Verrucomicrobiota bacterium]
MITLTAMPAVRCSALLSVVDWTLVLLWARFISILVCQAGLLVLLYFEIRIIREWYRESRDDNGKNGECPSELNDSPRGKFGKLRSGCVQFREACRHLHSGVIWKCFRSVRNVLLNLLNVFCQYLGFAHKREETPNF